MAFRENLRRLRLGHTVRALAEALRLPPGELATPEEVAEADRRTHQRAERQPDD